MSETTIKKPKKPRVPRPPHVLHSDTLVVLNIAPQNVKCKQCGGGPGIEFSAYDARERERGGVRVISACKACCERYAIEHGLVIRVSGNYRSLDQFWKRNRRRQATEAQKERLAIGLRKWRETDLDKRLSKDSGQNRGTPLGGLFEEES